MNFRRLLATVLIFAALYGIVYFWKRHSANKDDAKLEDVRRLYAALPLYPGFKEVNSSYESKVTLVHLDKTFVSDAPYDQVKSFYIDKLSKAGWRRTGERKMKDWWRDFGGRELTFRKGEYSIVIEYSGERTDTDWTYAVSLDWSC